MVKTDTPLPVHPARLIDTSLSVRILWRDEAGQTHKKTQPWRREVSTAALHEWIQEYFQAIASGYQPAGFEKAPIPHCVRILRNGTVLAEIFPRIAPESTVDGPFNLTPGGVPVAVPPPPQEAKPNLQDEGIGSDKQAETMQTPVIGQAVTSGSGKPVA